MDCQKVGKLITELRKEKGLTQKQLADLMNLSDKTVSKWERGLGCPDVSLLNELSGIFNINIEKLLAGELNQKIKDSGNFKRIKFYLCPACGTIATATGDADVSCCGRKLSALVAKKADESHSLKVENIEDDLYLTFSHEMQKNHYISFISYVGYDRMLNIKMYPEQSGEARFPKMRGGKIYYICSCHGLFVLE